MHINCVEAKGRTQHLFDANVQHFASRDSRHCVTIERTLNECLQLSRPLYDCQAAGARERDSALHGIVL